MENKSLIDSSGKIFHSTDDENSELEEHCNLYTFVVCVIVIGLVCLFGLAGNVLSFIVLWKHKTENAAIFLLQCMAVFDFLLLVVTLFIYTFPAIYPYTGRMRAMHDSYESTIIVFVWPLGTMLHTATIWLTVLVTINRYNAVCRAIEEFGANSLKNTKIQVTIVIIFSIVYNTPRFFEHMVIDAIPPINVTNETTAAPSSTSSSSSEQKNITTTTSTTTTSSSIEVELMVLGDNQIYQIIYSNLFYYPVMYILPLASLAYLNAKLIMSLKAFKQKALTSGRRNNKDDNITHCVIAIVCVFIVSQTPALLNQIFWATFSNEDRDCGHFHFYYTKASDLLVVVNSSCNFVVYCLFGRTFRQIFLDTVRCRDASSLSLSSRLSQKSTKSTRYTHVEQVPMRNVNTPSSNGTPKITSIIRC